MPYPNGTLSHVPMGLSDYLNSTFFTPALLRSLVELRMVPKIDGGVNTTNVIALDLGQLASAATDTLLEGADGGTKRPIGALSSAVACCPLLLLTYVRSPGPGDVIITFCPGRVPVPVGAPVRVRNAERHYACGGDQRNARQDPGGPGGLPAGRCGALLYSGVRRSHIDERLQACSSAWAV